MTDEQPRILESIAIHPTAEHGTMIVASYDGNTAHDSWRCDKLDGVLPGGPS